MVMQEYQTTEKYLKERLPLLKEHFDNGHTLDLAERKKALIKLKTNIQKYSDDICEAIFKDFHKPKSEMLLTEIYTVLSDLDHTINHIDKWAKPQAIPTSVLLLPATSKIYKSPKGLVLIIAPWNYPFYLSMMPLIAAVAAGNCVVVKPANETYHTSLVIQKIAAESFDSRHVITVLGEGALTGSMLLDNFQFNHVFFTGSARVGKWIMEKAAKNLTPITLELGGKSPAIIEKGYDLNRAAKKIVWGKFINAGQTCVATDYVLVHKDDEAAFIESCKKYIIELFGSDVFGSKEYSHMINEVRFDKVVSYLENEKIVFGGKYDKASRCIEPTLIKLDDLDKPIMKDEIFGPILPIITYDSKDKIIATVRKNRYPLALYLFNNSSSFKDYIFSKIEFGGGCVHNTVYHLGNPNLPFGGIHTSGFGQYHGKVGFDTFSNTKSVLSSAKWFDLSLLYQPYTEGKLALIRMLFRI